ncbi:MAG: short-chain dehydrogenase [Proteobacteria bacterium]|nr:MAG: short-chain dehydrogenase [Pseudomonadota bacterium]
MQLRPLSEQVVVITGASSGIGLATARMAAQRGARVVLSARSEDALAQAAEEIRRDGGDASHFAADVAEPEAMERLARHARERFGGIDTWVNNAGVSVYGRAEQVSLADMRQLFDVDFWGMVHGCRAALPELKRRGGALINVGSVESEVAAPLTAAYAAAKHAMKGFTDALRVELRNEDAPVSVSLVKPGSIDTPFFEHAKNYMQDDPKPPSPVYAPEVVARAILECAERPVRDVVVGGAGRFQIGVSRMLPRLADRMIGAVMFGAQQRPPRPGRDPEGALYQPQGTYGRARGDHEGHVMRSSAYTHATLHPIRTLALVAAAGAAAMWLGRRVRS